MLGIWSWINTFERSVRRAWRSHVVVVAMLLALGTRVSHAGEPSTLNLRDIFLGRCWEYQHIINPTEFSSNKKNCTLLWQQFSEAFVNRDPCDVPMKRYEKFANYAKHPIPRDKILFWSGVYPFVYRYTELGKRYFAIGDTLTGYVVNHLQWCGTEETPGIDYLQCPSWNICNETAEKSFWKITSIEFASLARGRAYLMLNASREVAFRQGSVFAQYELPNLNSSFVEVLELFLVKFPDEPARATCSTGSIVRLRALVEDKGIIFKCTENPHDILHLVCSNDSTACEDLINAASRETSQLLTSIVFILACYFVHRTLILL